MARAEAADCNYSVVWFKRDLRVFDHQALVEAAPKLQEHLGDESKAHLAAVCAVLDAAAVVAHCRSLIAGYKCPRSVEFRDALPITAAGKVQKVELRAPFWAGRSRNVN